MKLNISNLLTIARIIVIPIIVVCIYLKSPFYGWVAFVLFCLASATDYFDGYIALGCVIKGKTHHFDLISQTVTKALMNLSVKYKKPIGNGIISCFNMKQAIERAGPKKKNKGEEAAKAVVQILT